VREDRPFSRASSLPRVARAGPRRGWRFRGNGDGLDRRELRILRKPHLLDRRPGPQLLFGELDGAGAEAWHGELDGPARRDDAARDIVALGRSALVVVGTYAILGEGTNVWVARYAR
jgi:hypothetical protein